MLYFDWCLSFNTQGRADKKEYRALAFSAYTYIYIDVYLCEIFVYRRFKATLFAISQKYETLMEQPY